MPGVTVMPGGRISGPLNCGRLVVDGALIVRGDVNCSELVVLGGSDFKCHNLTATRVSSSGSWLCCHNLSASEVNAYTISCTGEADVTKLCVWLTAISL